MTFSHTSNKPPSIVSHSPFCAQKQPTIIAHTQSALDFLVYVCFAEENLNFTRNQFKHEAIENLNGRFTHIPVANSNNLKYQAL